MGQSNSNLQPIPDHSIIVSQKLEWGTCYCGYSGIVTPSWIVTDIDLESSNLGLTQQILSQEIDKINATAAEYMRSQSNACRYYWWLGAVISILIVVIGFIVILIIDPQWLFVMFGLIGGSILIIYLFNFAVLCYYLKKWNKCLECIGKYIVDLNMTYDSQNIQWSIRKKKIRHGCGRSSYLVEYMDIIISPSSEYNPPQTNMKETETHSLISNKH